MVDLAAWEAVFAAREPELHAFVEEAERFDRVRGEAARLAARFPDPASRPPLYGLLLGVKDIFRVAGLPTRAGSRLPAVELAGPESECVTALRAAGAIVVGKTVTTEFAYFAPGPTRNPAAPGHTPGGSSSGSAAAVAAGLCDLALGTQTIGSIGRPAAYCGVVGFKPSYERISRRDVVPLAPSADHVGLFARTVAPVTRGARVLLDGWRESARASWRGRRSRVGVPRGPYLEPLSEEGRRHFEQTLGRLGAAGFEPVEVEAMPDFADIAARHRLLVAAEAAVVHADWFARYAGRYAEATAELILAGRRAKLAEVERARAGRERLRGELEELMDRRDVELWVSPPALGPAPAGLGSTGDPVMNLPWTHAGLPTIVLPAGWCASGLPMGLQIATRFGADEELLAAAAELEAALSPLSSGGRA